MKTIQCFVLSILVLSIVGCEVKKEFPEMKGEWIPLGESKLSEIRYLDYLVASSEIIAGGVAIDGQIGFSKLNLISGEWMMSLDSQLADHNISWIEQKSDEIWISVFSKSNDVGQFWISKDHGGSWTEQIPLPENADPRCFMLTGNDPESIILGTVNDGVFMSVDRGISWTQPITAPDDAGIQSIAANSGNSDHLIIGTRVGICESHDKGQNWSSISSKISLDRFFVVEVKAHPLKPDCFTCIYRTLSGAASIALSTDGAKTWKSIRNGFYPDSQPRCIGFHPTQPDVMFCGTVIDGIYRTDSLGDSWFPINNGLPLKDQLFIVHSLLSLPGNPPTLYAGSNIKGQAFKLEL